LDKLFKAINRFDVAQGVVLKVALANARMKLKLEAFVHNICSTEILPGLQADRLS
jgi:hypothetical protein